MCIKQFTRFSEAAVTGKVGLIFSFLGHKGPGITLIWRILLLMYNCCIREREVWQVSGPEPAACQTLETPMSLLLFRVRGSVVHYKNAFVTQLR